MVSPRKILQEYWGYNTFRPGQEEIIEAVLEGKDVLAVLPTGGGKSACFQVPAMVKEGLCLVISPLIALMKDQVQNLRKKNITSFAIYSGMSRKEVHAILKQATESHCKFLYVSPERLGTNVFKEWLPSLPIQLIAVDEAHCISQWGYDFRPSYLKVALLREYLADVPVLALTASATEEIQKDICEKLQFKNGLTFKRSFARDNLSLSVFEVDSKINKIREVLTKVNGSAIVYCRTRKRCKDFSQLLNMHGISSDFYHAGLKQGDRNQKQVAWMKGETRVIVCTNAFGMGIDKPDVRVVIHADVPDSMENYYQEAGRAGRDGNRSYAVLLQGKTESDELRSLPDIHYPKIEEIRKIYQAAANYLQIPSGTESVYYNFDFTDFTKTFKLEPNLALYALKALEQDEWLVFNEQAFVPSTADFIVDRASLEAFEKLNPSLDPLIKCLLRTYAGIFDYPVSIHEKTIATLLRKQIEVVISDLQKLHVYGIIDYSPQKDSPQLYLAKPRVPAANVKINEENYSKRKESYRKRVESMLDYLGGKECRTVFISNYFGERAAKPCGICDSCLSKKNKSLTKQEFEDIYQRVKEKNKIQ
ncbi:MAG: RecQ family ATP-dependent DNA helicase [Bacteroidetes bacterium]|nr:MAG: RecQ family ATP-dependent DNA helicase [Bacteroidota bacterium]